MVKILKPKRDSKILKSPTKVVLYAPDDKIEIAPSDLNREQWLTEMARRIEPLFDGFKIGEYRVTCGWPHKFAIASKHLRVGECHYPRKRSGDDTVEAGVHEIFISPLRDDSLEVAGILTHELTHVVAGFGAGHGKDFTKIGKHVGLTHGKPTSLMPGEALNDRLRGYVETMGGYPHKAIVPTLRRKEKNYKEVPLVCGNCSCVVRMSRKWLEEAGLPTCCCGTEFIEKPPKENKDA